MQIMEISGHRARCTAHGIQRDVNLYLLQDRVLTPGDFVLVHVGYAIQTVDPVQARLAADTWVAMQNGAPRDA